MTPLLDLSGLTRRYAGLVAVDGVDMQVMPGGVHAVIGPNGAGKTTLFSLVSGLVPSRGKVARRQDGALERFSFRSGGPVS